MATCQMGIDLTCRILPVGRLKWSGGEFRAGADWIGPGVTLWVTREWLVNANRRLRGAGGAGSGLVGRWGSMGPACMSTTLPGRSSVGRGPIYDPTTPGQPYNDPAHSADNCPAPTSARHHVHVYWLSPCLAYPSRGYMDVGSRGPLPPPPPQAPASHPLCWPSPPASRR